MIVSNKMSSSPGELYSLRREVIRFHESTAPEWLDLYGVGWDGAADWRERLWRGNRFTTALSKGPCAEKLTVLADYEFTWCLDNQRVNNYIDEKIFDALFAGSVPVYLGAPNVAEWIPSDCFIDVGRFASLGDLFAYMQEVSRSGAINVMRERGREFLNGEGFEPFSLDRFCASVEQSILEMRV